MYEELSLQYFYLRDLDRANYYHVRSFKGCLESKVSVARQYLDHYAKQKTEKEHWVDFTTGAKTHQNVFEVFEKFKFTEFEVNDLENHVSVDDLDSEMINFERSNLVYDGL